MTENCDSRVEALESAFSQDAFPQKLGAALMEISPGYAKVKMKITSDMVNMHGIAHGGAIFTLADTAFGLAANTRGDAVALQVSINYIRPVNPGEYAIAIATEEEVTRKTGIYSVTVETTAGNVVALFRGTVFRK